MVLLRTRIDGFATSSICAVCDLADDGTNMDLQFTQFYPMPGAQNKFHIIYDDVSGLFWMTTNLVVDSQNSQGWLKKLYKMGFQAGCVAMWPSLMQSFNYTAPLIDGQDMLILSCTSRNSRNQHDADLVTFHRVGNFRSLALDLYPQM